MDVAEAETTKTLEDSSAAWPEEAHSLKRRSELFLIRSAVDLRTSAGGHIVASCYLDDGSCRRLSLIHATIRYRPTRLWRC